MPKKRAQAAIEYVLVLGTLLIALGYVGYSVLNESETTIKLAKARNTVDSIAKAADSVYSLGPCSKTYVEVSIPDSVEETSVSDNIIELKIGWAGGRLVRECSKSI